VQVIASTKTNRVGATACNVRCLCSAPMVQRGGIPPRWSWPGEEDTGDVGSSGENKRTIGRPKVN